MAAEIFAGRGQNFFVKISVKLRLYSISPTLLKILLRLKTDANYGVHSCMKTVAH